MRRRLHLYKKHHTSLLEEPVTETNIFGAVALRNLAFLLDPIIAHALLGLTLKLSMHPPLPKKSEFSSNGYRLNPKSIAKEVHDLLFSGRVEIFKEDAGRIGSTLGFSQALRDALWNALRGDTQSEIRDYILTRAAREGLTQIRTAATTAPSADPSGPETATVPFSVTNAGSATRRRRPVGTVVTTVELIAENDELQRELALCKRQKVDAEGRAHDCEMRMLQSQQEVTELKRVLSQANRRIRKWEKKWKMCRAKHHRANYRLRHTPDLGLNGRKPVEVNNVCFDPRSQREAGQKRKRDPSLAFECAWVMIKGTKEIKPFGGGLRWTVEARYQEYAHFERSGVDSARRAVWLREAALHGRASRVFIVPIGRKGHLRRNVLTTNKQKKARAEKEAQKEQLAMDLLALSLGENNPAKIHDVSAEGIAARDKELTVEKAVESSKALEGIRLYDHPSSRTTFRDIIPTCQLLFSRKIGDILYAPSTVMINLCADFAKAKSFACMGSVVQVMQSRVVKTDPFDGVLWEIIPRSFNLPMTQANSKVVRGLVGSDGTVLSPRAPHCLAKAMYVGNVARHMHEHPGMWLYSSDGAAENCGLGEELARENFCGTGGVFRRVFLTGEAWTGVIKGAEQAKLLYPMDEFFGNVGFKWLETQAAEASAEAQGSRTDAAADGCAAAGAAPHCQQEGLEVPLDTTSSVYKDPAVAEELRGKFVEETRAAKLKDRDETLRVLRAAVDTGPKANWGIEAYGPFHDETERRRCELAAEQAAVKLHGPFRDRVERERRERAFAQLRSHEAEFQRRLWNSRKKSLLLYEERIRILDEEEQQPRSADPPVSMEHNPARFLPCRCKPDGRPVGEGRHCGMHRLHNLTDLMLASLNKGFLEQCVSVTTYFRSEHHWAHLRSAINFFMVPSQHEEIKLKTSFYSDVMNLVLDVMELENLIEQCEFDIKNGATPPNTAGIARWASALEAAEYIFKNHPLLGLALIKRCTKGLEQNKIPAAADILTPRGFESSKFPNLQIEHHAMRPFAFVTRKQDLVQVAIASVVNAVVERFLLQAISSDHECGLQAMGLNSILRCVLMVLERDMWLLVAPHRGWGRGWNQWAPLAFRTPGAEFHPEAHLRLLNPHCRAKLRQRFRDFPGYEKLVDGAATAISAFVQTVKTLARRPGPMLPEDSLELWKEDFPELARMTAEAPGLNADFKHRHIYEGRESFAAGVSQAYWLMLRVTRDCRQSLVKVHGGMHRELFQFSGWIASLRLCKLSPQHRIRLKDGSEVLSSVVMSHDLARASAANLFVLSRDLIAHYQQQGIGPEEVQKRLPTYCQALFAKEELEQFFSQREGRAQLEGDGPSVLDADGFVDIEAHRSLKKPVSCYPVLYASCQQACACLCNSKLVESSFSPLKVILRAKGQALFPYTSMLYRRSNCSTAMIDAEETITGDKTLYWRAHELAQHPGWDWVNTRDDILGDVMKEADIQDRLQKENKTVFLGGDFRNTRHGVSSRTDRYSGAHPAGRGRGSGRGREARLGRGARRGAGRGARSGAGRGGAGPGAGLGAGRGRKRAREETVDLPLHAADYEHANALHHGPRVAVKRVCVKVPVTPLLGLKEGKLAPERSKHARRCLAKQKYLLDTARAKRRKAQLQAEREERMQLANDPDSDPGGESDPASAPASNRDDDADFEPHEGGSTSKRGCPRSTRGSAPGKRTRRDPGSHDYASADESDAPSETIRLDPSAATARTAKLKTRSRGAGAIITVGSRRGRRAARTGRRGGETPTKLSGQGQDDDKSIASDDDESDVASDDSDSDDWDSPLRKRKPEAVFVAAPAVGAKVDIKWDQTKWPDRNGWCRGVVTAISDGNLRAPPVPGCRRQAKRVVKANFSIVRYGTDDFVHKLDREHHVSNWGDRVGAWRLDDCRENGRSAAGMGRGAGAVGASAEGAQRRDRGEDVLGGTDTDDSDNAPLFPGPREGCFNGSGGAGGDRAGAAARSAIAGCDIASAGAAPESQLRLSKEAEAAPRQRDSVRADASVTAPRNVWSLSFCRNVFGRLPPERFRLGTVRFSAGMCSVTRRMPMGSQFPEDAEIHIPVRTETSKLYYMAYTQETGLAMFAVIGIRRPDGEDWSKTLSVYQVFTSEEALNRVDQERDTVRKGCATSLGKASLRHRIAFDRERGQTTYHACDWLVNIDARCIVGVVRQALAKDRTEPYDWRTHAASGCPRKASLIYTDLTFSESRNLLP